MSITQAAFDGVCMQNLDLKRQNQAMKEALEEFCRLYSEPNYWKECTPGSAYTKAKLALKLANGEDKEP